MSKLNERVNQFGQRYCSILIKEKNGKYGRGYLEIGNKLYKVSVSGSNKENATHWVKIEETQNQRKSYARNYNKPNMSGGFTYAG